MHCRLAISVLALSASIVGAAPLHSSQTRDHSTISIAVAQATSVDQQVAAVMQQHEEIQLPAAVPEVANDVVYVLCFCARKELDADRIFFEQCSANYFIRRFEQSCTPLGCIHVIGRCHRVTQAPPPLHQEVSFLQCFTPPHEY